MNGHKCDNDRDVMRQRIYKILSKRMGVDNSLRESSVRAIEYLSEKAEQMVFPIDRRQAICLITLVFCFLNEEWDNAGRSNPLYCVNNGQSTEWFLAGAKRIYGIIKGTARNFQAKRILENE